jgi:chromate transport protein ChrA
MNKNPYATPSHTQTATSTAVESPRRGFGIVCAAVLAVLYAVVLAMSVYEYLSAPGGFSTLGYVRHGIASAMFVLICCAAIRALWMERTHARWLLAISPILICVFVYPGLNNVCNSVAELFW